MPLTTASLNSEATALAAAYPYLSLHSANPGTSGVNETTAARRPANWSAAANGGITATNVPFTGVTSSGPVTYVGLWSATSGGTFGGSFPLSGAQAANSAGAYTVTTLTVTGTAS